MSRPKFRCLVGRSGALGFALTAWIIIPGIARADDAPAYVGEAQKIVQSGYKGNFDPPPSRGPAAVRGKKVWYISCGQAYTACSTMASGFAEAGKDLGWEVTIQDGKATPSVAADIIRLGVAAKVDAIGLLSFDCPGIKSALLQAKQEKVPVEGGGSLDCDDPTFGKQEPLFAATLNLLGSTNAGEFYYKMGQARGYYILAKTNGHANVVSINETGQRIQQMNSEGFRSVMKPCTDCKIDKTDFNFGQVPNPATQIWKSAVLRNKDVNVIEYGIDALMDLGLRPAVQQIDLKNVIVGGGEGYPNNFGLIRQGIQTFSVAVPYVWVGMAQADNVNRILAGQNPKDMPSEGAGFEYVDKDHNLPPEGPDLRAVTRFQVGVPEGLERQVV
jgi:ribose transport system substrate-binding protein